MGSVHQQHGRKSNHFVTSDRHLPTPDDSDRHLLQPNNLRHKMQGALIFSYKVTMAVKNFTE